MSSPPSRRPAPSPGAKSKKISRPSHALWPRAAASTSDCSQTAPAVAHVPQRTGFVKQRGVRLCDKLSRLPTATAGVMHRALHVTAPPPAQIFGDVYDVYGRSRRRPCYRPLHVMPPTVVLHSSVDNWGCARPFLNHFPEHGCSDGGKDSIAARCTRPTLAPRQRSRCQSHPFYRRPRTSCLPPTRRAWQRPQAYGAGLLDP